MVCKGIKLWFGGLQVPTGWELLVKVYDLKNITRACKISTNFNKAYKRKSRPSPFPVYCMSILELSYKLDDDWQLSNIICILLISNYLKLLQQSIVPLCSVKRLNFLFLFCFVKVSFSFHSFTRKKINKNINKQIKLFH